MGMVHASQSPRKLRSDRRRERKRERKMLSPPSLVCSARERERERERERWKGRTIGDKTRQLINREGKK